MSGIQVERESLTALEISAEIVTRERERLIENNDRSRRCVAHIYQHALVTIFVRVNLFDIYSLQVALSY